MESGLDACSGLDVVSSGTASLAIRPACPVSVVVVTMDCAICDGAVCVSPLAASCSVALAFWLVSAIANCRSASDARTMFQEEPEGLQRVV
jgi:hypothetical protein